MNTNEPTPPNVQINTVEFSPPSEMGETAGSLVAPPPERPPLQFTAFVPMALLMLTLNFMMVRDIITLNKRLTTINTDNEPNLKILKDAPKQTEFVDAMRADLTKLAVTDAAAKRILLQFYPTLPAPPKDGDAAKSGNGSKAPAK